MIVPEVVHGSSCTLASPDGFQFQVDLEITQTPLLMVCQIVCTHYPVMSSVIMHWMVLDSTARCATVQEGRRVCQVALKVDLAII